MYHICYSSGEIGQTNCHQILHLQLSHAAIYEVHMRSITSEALKTFGLSHKRTCSMVAPLTRKFQHKVLSYTNSQLML